MATIVVEQVAVVKNGGGYIAKFPEKNGEAADYITKGMLVWLESGLLCKWADADTAVLGIVLEDATGVDYNMLDVFVFAPDTEVVLNVADSNAHASGVTAYNLIGTTQPLMYDSGVTSAVVCDIYGSNSNTALVHIRGLDTRDTLGDLHGRLRCNFLAGVCQGFA